MKKRNILMLVVAFVLMFALVPNTLAANIKGCETLLPGLAIDEKIPDTVHTIVVVIKIVVPILLVIFGMLDLFKGVMAQKDDEIKKGQQIFIKRLIAAAIVFFVIQIVQLLISFVADADEEKGILDCANCFLNGSDSAECKGE